MNGSKDRPRALVCGAGGFIGSHLVRRLKNEGFWVRGVDLKYPEFSTTEADEFLICDLRDCVRTKEIFDLSFTEVYQLAADMGGAGFIFTGDNDADIMYNSVQININVLEACKLKKPDRIFYSSSACIYPYFNQTDPDNPKCSEESAYPAQPDSEYGWEKMFSERLYLTYARNHDIPCRIGRYHNVFGPEGTWRGGREKSPAAICRKVAEADNHGHIEIWGDGKQTRSFLYIDECLEGTLRLARSTCVEPLNIGSDEMVTINALANQVMSIADKSLEKIYVEGPLGVRGRNSDNSLIEEKLNWKPHLPLTIGLKSTYEWIAWQVKTNSFG